MRPLSAPASAARAPESGIGGRTVGPDGVLGVLGGGQLGRMLALAARRLGLGVTVWSPDPASPAFGVADHALVAPFDDATALRRFAAQADVVTLEFENVPTEPLAWLAQRLPVRPGPAVLRTAQHRVREKRFLRSIGVHTVPFEVIDRPGGLEEALARIGRPAVLKSAALGYDGRGQVRIEPVGAPGRGPVRAAGQGPEHAEALELLRRGSCVLERRVELAAEISVLVARGIDGAMQAYPVFENAHSRHVLDVTVVPARVSPRIAAEATATALRIAQALELTGLVCVECFVTPDGEVLVNELAPRPHNSGHITIEACETDQFEQAVRAACGLPLGGTELRCAGAMANLVGDLWSHGEPDWGAALALPGVHLHIYGKKAARPGRKMGHLSVLDAAPNEAERRVRQARAALIGSAKDEGAAGHTGPGDDLSAGEAQGAVER